MNDFEMNSILDPHALLAVKIVERAVFDWRLLMKGSKIAKVGFDEIRGFLTGAWCAKLLSSTDVTGEWVLQKLEQEFIREGCCVEKLVPEERKMGNKKAITIDGRTASVYRWCQELRIDTKSAYRWYKNRGRSYTEQRLAEIKRWRDNA